MTSITSIGQEKWYPSKHLQHCAPHSHKANRKKTNSWSVEVNREPLFSENWGERQGVWPGTATGVLVTFTKSRPFSGPAAFPDTQTEL